LKEFDKEGYFNEIFIEGEEECLKNILERMNRRVNNHLPSIKLPAHFSILDLDMLIASLKSLEQQSLWSCISA